MKLKTLSIVAAVLAVASIATWLFKHRDTSKEADPRVGATLLDADTVAKIARIHFKTGGKEITLINQDPAGSTWVVSEYYDLPVDFSKLTKLITDLREAKVLRFVSAKSERMARMEFGDTEITLFDKDGKTIWNVDLGKSTTGGGRFIKFGKEEKAYLTGLSTWLDSTAKSWANASLVDVKPEEVTGIEVGFESGEPLKLTRENATAKWTGPTLAEGERVKESAITSMLNSLTGLRFTDTTGTDSEDAVAARAHGRTFKLTTTDGRTLTLLLGRKPAPPPPPPPPEPAEGEEKPKTPPAPKPGPVFAFITSSRSTDPINELMNKRAFQIAEWTFTGLPADRDALVNAAPPPPPPPATDDKDGTASNTELKSRPTSFPDEPAETAFIADEYSNFKVAPDGIRYKVVKEGTGEKPKEGDRVKAHYAGRLLNGKEFDSSYKRNEPFSFVLGKGQVIKGWDDTLLDMKKGEKRLVVIPYRLGYGEKGAPPDIPARATLVFDIELVDFE